MSTSPNDFNAGVIEEFRANDGQVGGMFTHLQLLLLHHTGAKSGTERVNPLAYRREGGDYVVFASKGGAPSNPDWYYNLLAHPDTKIEVGSASIPVHAHMAEGAERARIYEAQAADAPQFAEYAEKADRVIPVVLLTPTG